MDELERCYREARDVILARQHPISGLLPASTAVNEHGDYTDAWVRDNVYAILAIWALALAFRKVDDPDGRGVELEHAVVRLMRGLLRAMMRQSHKVESFKHRQDPRDALHAKFDTASGDPVVADDAWGHLQLDATSLYLLALAQMTASGFAIVQSEAEVRFVQNLVFYVGRAYRTPDYGIWERGDKTNHGLPELNASSVGMAKAALEALSGLNLYGPRGGHASVVHVDPDEIARARTTLSAMLPRESASKEVDAALLSIVGFPAFAVDDDALEERTRSTIVEKLRGRYGLKRFLRDGHQAVNEDPARLHYEPEELERFAGIESEWPLFEAFLALDALFRGDGAEAEGYLRRLDDLALDVGGVPLLP
jgi:phosphorylase kinase alpha/beta subunit